MIDHDFYEEQGEEVNACCQRGVWHTGHDLGIENILGTLSPVGKEEIRSKLQDVLDKDRKDDCFFIPYQEGMSFDGAKELHRIRYEDRSLKRTLKIAVVGLYISGFSAFLNFIGIEKVEKIFGQMFGLIAEWISI